MAMQTDLSPQTREQVTPQQKPGEQTGAPAAAAGSAFAISPLMPRSAATAQVQQAYGDMNAVQLKGGALGTLGLVIGAHKANPKPGGGKGTAGESRLLDDHLAGSEDGKETAEESRLMDDHLAPKTGKGSWNAAKKPTGAPKMTIGSKGSGAKGSGSKNTPTKDTPTKDTASTKTEAAAPKQALSLYDQEREMLSKLSGEAKSVASVSDFKFRCSSEFVEMAWTGAHKSAKMSYNAFVQKTQQKVKGITKEECLALSAYTGPAYTLINQFLRGQIKSPEFTAVIQPVISHATSAIDKLSRGKEVKSTRGIAKFPPGGADFIRAAYGNGRKYTTEAAFMSTTVTKGGVALFNGPASLDITSHSGAMVQDFSLSPSEAELLLPPECEFKILSFEEDSAMLKAWEAYAAAGYKSNELTGLPARPAGPAFKIKLKERG